MLKNKTEQNVLVRYNGIDVDVQAGGMLDVIDFGVTSTFIKTVEDHVNKTHPNKFETIARPTHGLSQMESDRKITALDKANADLKAECTTLKAQLKTADETLREKENIISSLESERLELKKTVNEYKAKLKKATA